MLTYVAESLNLCYAVVTSLDVGRVCPRRASLQLHCDDEDCNDCIFGHIDVTGKLISLKIDHF